MSFNIYIPEEEIKFVTLAVFRYFDSNENFFKLLNFWYTTITTVRIYTFLIVKNNRTPLLLALFFHQKILTYNSDH
jgi:hypothetical protein